MNGHSIVDRVSVMLPVPINSNYDYRCGGNCLCPGDIVEVPFGARLLVGVVIGPGEGQIAEIKLRPISRHISAISLTKETMDFIYWVASYNMIPVGLVLKMVLSIPDVFNRSNQVVAFSKSDLAPSENMKMTSGREKVLEFLTDKAPRTLSEIRNGTNVSNSVIKGLIKTGSIEQILINSDPVDPLPDLPVADAVILNAEQTAAAKSLCAAVDKKQFSVWLIDGVTGSGKTEVYFEAVAEAMRSGSQVLILVPEIALSQSFLKRFQKRFGIRPAEWHSDLSKKIRRTTWRTVAEGRAKVVIGARSALFLPFRNLGLIVVDEEHEASFKQLEGTRYHCRDMAVVRARIIGIPTILVSATPSLETLHNVELGRYTRVSLLDRFGGAELPVVEAIDLRRSSASGGGWISPKLQQAIAETLDRKEQILLFLNRRGYAPLNVCNVCGYRHECSSCSSWLVQHKGAAQLQCHHCGFTISIPSGCPACDAIDALTAAGPGVERIAEEVFSLFPKARSRIASSDTFNSTMAANELIDTIRSGEVDIVIGTQVIAKGYHFPKITCVGVLDADLGLSGGDLRAGERTYQLLHQVAGRAGREYRKGKVWLQTRQPENPLIKALVNWDRKGFLDIEKRARREAGMPPYGRLVSIVVSAVSSNQADDTARLVAASSPLTDRAEILGPAPAPIAILRGRHRRRFLIKADKNLNVQKLVAAWLSAVKIPRKSRVEIDVDPYSFL